MAVISPLLRGERVTLDGQYYEIEDCVLLPPPMRRIPILIAGKGERMLSLVAEHADALERGVVRASERTLPRTRGRPATGLRGRRPRHLNPRHHGGHRGRQRRRRGPHRCRRAPAGRRVGDRRRIARMGRRGRRARPDQFGADRPPARRRLRGRCRAIPGGRPRLRRRSDRRAPADALARGISRELSATGRRALPRARASPRNDLGAAAALPRARASPEERSRRRRRPSRALVPLRGAILDRAWRRAASPAPYRAPRSSARNP